MALKPIDLQVLFSRLNELSREQAVQKELLVHQQTVKTSELLKETEQKTHTVTHPSEVEQGETEKIRNERKGKGQRYPAGARPSKPSSDQKENQDEDIPVEVVKDPNLGKNIDLTG
ncbi:MAG: hypothetical protein N2442_00865 [Spirochaetes bacterium]|nr:hypothetical protein [Spirochaetota bacterium]